MADNDLKARLARGVQRGSGGGAGAATPTADPTEPVGVYGGRATKRTSMVLYHDALREMQFIALARETNVSVLVREAMDQWLQRHDDERTRQERPARDGRQP